MPGLGWATGTPHEIPLLIAGNYMSTHIRGFARKLWNPFSLRGRELRLEAKADLLAAQTLAEKGRQFREAQESLFKEQLELAENLRLERRKNHFAQLFADTIPIRSHSPE